MSMQAQIPDCVAVITARGGSKGIPRKNLVSLGGIPLLAHTIRAALDAKRFSSVIVSSDCPEILEVARAEGASPLVRPPEISGDYARSEDALRHALVASGTSDIEGIAVLLQPTSPLRTAQDIQQALDTFSAGSCASLISVVECDHPPQKSLTIDESGHAQPLLSWEMLTIPRQALPRTFRPNGSIYVFRTTDFLASGFLFAQPMGILIMSAESSIDIDNLEDLARAEQILSSRLAYRADV